MSTTWPTLAHRAVASLTASGPPNPVTASVSFVALDGSAGVIHVHVTTGLTRELADRLGEDFAALCQAGGRPVRVVSVIRSPGRPLEVTLVPVSEGVSFAVEVRDGDGGVVRQLHITRSIEAAQQLAEASVLDIGQEVRGIFELARTQTGRLEGLVDQYSSAAGHDTIATTIDSLGETVTTLTNALVERVATQANALQQAQQWSNDIVRLGEAIGTIAASARMLTFNARIESARIGAAGRGFAVIAQSIQDLASQVREANDSVGSLAINLSRTLPKLGAEAQTMADEAREQLGTLTRSLERVRHQLEVTRTEARDSLVDSSENAAALKGRANHVIEKLQFQDRAHQMLEEARVQATALLRLLGLEERHVDQRVVEQVGWLGKQLEGTAGHKEAGSVELF